MLGGTPGALVPGTLVVYPCDRGWVGLNVFGADSATGGGGVGRSREWRLLFF